MINYLFCDALSKYPEQINALAFSNSNNRITQEGAVAIAKVLATNESLKILRVSVDVYRYMNSRLLR